MPSSLNAADILRELDRLSDSHDFVDLDNENFEPVAARLSAYSDGADWAIIIELVEVSYGSFYKIHDDLYCYGSCLLVPTGMLSRAVHLVDSGPDGPLFDEQDTDYVRSGVKTLLMRGRLIPVPMDLDEYALNGIPLQSPPRIDAAAMARLLGLRHPELFFEPDSSLEGCLAVSLPLILRLHEWHHPSWVARDERPSDTACFPMIAEAMTKADPTLYVPVEVPNTDWRDHPG